MIEEELIQSHKTTKTESPVQDFLLSLNHANLILPP